MTFFQIYIQGLFIITAFFTLIWVLSVYLKNAGIVDIFWGLGYVLVNGFYFFTTPGFSALKIATLVLVTIWGLRLSAHIFFRNLGKPEDYRYQEFRKNYGEKRYWWFSFFQVFLLQGVLVWFISAPLFAISYYSAENTFWPAAVLGILVWLIGFIFEAGGDWQLSRFKAKNENKEKLLTTGFWKYTRHPNYFGDAAVWWGFAILSMSTGCWIPVLSAVLMNWLLLRVSGVAMLERTMIKTKPGFEDYINQTNAFLPWFPKKIKPQS